MQLCSNLTQVPWFSQWNTPDGKREFNTKKHYDKHLPYYLTHFISSMNDIIIPRFILDENELSFIRSMVDGIPPHLELDWWMNNMANLNKWHCTISDVHLGIDIDAVDPWREYCRNILRDMNEPFLEFQSGVSLTIEWVLEIRHYLASMKRLDLVPARLGEKGPDRETMCPSPGIPNPKLLGLEKSWLQPSPSVSKMISRIRTVLCKIGSEASVKVVKQHVNGKNQTILHALRTLTYLGEYQGFMTNPKIRST
ncbi:hypothetical protein BH11PLA2_BH11PLA2_30920 [soil metagenome]